MCSSLISITIPNSVKFIGDEAFCFCDRLKSINIPDSVTKIGKKSFGWNYDLVICASEGSYAIKYAKKNKKKYKII